ncbi:putative inactive disease susceptibility protein LOV1 [Eucalyptus grandis]|uniref:putative inactive disease susceptibility protein LOV1 n=1 Tax=Eucalyptus grandis TaxID=71139 RepID=UPI00192ECFD6|nr:putative inactive disease susceptibility protein LOV1 [Eucalyptus grandis]
MEASEGQRPRNPLAKTLSWVCSGSSRSRQPGKGETGKMLAPEVGTSRLNAKRSIVASSPSELPQARKMKDESHIWGREDFAKKLVSQLIDEKGECANLRVISVVGEGAIGKTALVRSVCNGADVKNHFDCCAWVRVGLEPNLVHLMVDLVKQLRVPRLQDVDHMDKKKLSDLLLGVLMKCRYLIVLDDLCDLHLMDKLIIKVLADSRNGSRVIITTRNTKIPSSIDSWYSEHLELRPLDQGQSNKLLEESSGAFDGVDLYGKLPHFKERILCKSGGSPAKILLLGGLLSTTTLRRCTELLNQLPDDPTVRDVMDLSVNDLPEGLKKCALYLALFPKESEIPMRRLFRLWSAENLVSSALESSAEEYFEILVSRNMVHVTRQKLDGSARSCRLPGSLYDVFYQMAKNEKFFNIYDCSIHEEGKFDAPRIAIHRDISAGGEAKAQINVPGAGRERSEIHAQEAHFTPTEPHQRMSAKDNSTPCGIQQLCSYVSFNTMKLGTRAGEIVALLKPLVPKRDSSLLRVLDLEGVYKPLLPEELGNILPNLKYLGLRWTLLERLPKSVAQLPCLETLDLKYTNISSLPESILEAENLRHLHMTKVDLDDSARRLLDSKKSLNCNIQTIWGLVINHDDSPMLEVLGKLTGLVKLALKWDGQLVSEATEYILNLEMLKSLKLELDVSSGEMGDMSRLKSLSSLYLLGELRKESLLESDIPPNLKVLTLSKSRLKEDPMGVLGKLKCLTTLRLFALSYEGKTLSISEGTFLSLRVLKLWRLRFLTAWTIQANAMPCLADLEIKDCERLKTIDGLQQINTLEVITLVRVPDELEQRVRDVQPNVPIIAKVLVIEFDTHANNKGVVCVYELRSKKNQRSNRMKKTANEEKDEDDYSE